MISTDQRIPPMGSEALDTNFSENILYADDPKQQLQHAADTTTQSINNSNKKHYNNIPHYEYWKNSLRDLLDDRDGYKTFYEFLEKEQLVVLFDCWYCCCQYRNLPPKKATAKDVYTRFVKIKDSRVPISDQARNNLAVRLRANDITEILLEEVEKEVYGNLRDICYPKFLKSDFFNLYCETSGQVAYTPSDFHSKFEKPSKCAGSVLNVVDEHQQITSNHSRAFNHGYDLQHDHSSSMHHDRAGYAPHSRGAVDLQGLSSDHAVTECDRISMTDSKTSMGSGSRHGRPSRSIHHDQLDMGNFQPRTQRINQDRMKQMKPVDFVAVLTQKLEKVILDRESQESSVHLYHGSDSMDVNSLKQALPGHYHHHQRTHSNNNTHYSYDYEQSECDAQSFVMSDRPSVAGQSSTSGSHSGIMVNKKAKELRDIVHQKLRCHLNECRCENCLQMVYQERNPHHPASTHSGSGRHEHSYTNHSSSSSRNVHPSASSHQQGSGYYPHSSHSQSYQHSTETVEDMNRYHTMSSSHRGSRTSHHNKRSGEVYENQEMAPPVDTSKIFSWMEKNEQYQFANPAPSPSLRRKKKTPLQYETSRSVNPIADTGMPLLPQPDPDNVLQEVKRVLEEPQQQHHHHHQQSHRPRQPAQYNHHPQDGHTGGDMYDKRSMASALSDASSMVSYNPSQVSTVPSSASRLWNAQGYFDTGSEVRDERHTPSEVRSQAVSRHSGQRSVTRSDHVNAARSEHHSDVRSQSTGRSFGSDNSKGRSKNKTVVTYYHGTEPIPYRISLPTTEVTLGQFKAETKRGNYRFFFKTVSSVDNEVVYEEVKNDCDLLPRYNDKIIGKVEKNC